MVRIFCGTKHQGHQDFTPHNGYQCTAIALIALIFFSTVLPNNPDVLHSPDTIDHLLFEGTNLYSLIQLQNPSIRGNLMHNQLPNSDINHQFQVRYVLDHFFGYVTDNEGNSNFLQLPFLDAIYQAILLSNTLLLTVNNYTIALYINTTQNIFTLFDSHSRNSSGQMHTDGYAIFMDFDSFDDQIAYIMNMYYGYHYDLTPVNVIQSSMFNSFTTNEPVFLNDNHSYCKSSALSEKPELSKNTKMSKFHHNLLDNPHFINIDATNSQHRNSARNQSHPSNPSTLNITLDNIACNCEINISSPHISNQADSLRKTQKQMKTTLRNPIRDHTYSASNKSKKRSKNKSAPKYNFLTLHDMLELQVQHNFSIDNNCNLYMHDSSNTPNIGYYVEILTSDNQDQDSVDKIAKQFPDLFHSLEYERNIRYKPSYTCASCKRILFKSQVKILHSDTEASKKLHFHTGSKFCSTCLQSLKNNEIPKLAEVFNNLEVPNIPSCLTNLSKIEKRLISQIQIFMTIIILPGGQLAEKGLVLNLPLDIQCIINQIPAYYTNSSMLMVVDFEQDKVQSGTYMASPFKLLQALNWLKDNNNLYSHLDMTKVLAFDQSQFTASDIDLDIIEDVAMTQINFDVPDIDISQLLPSKNIFVPRIQSQPIDILSLENGEEKAFPHLFVNGQNGLNFPRCIKINPSMYFKQRLYNVDSRWRLDPTYLLYTSAAYDMYCMKKAVTIHMKITKPSTYAGNTPLQLVTAGDIRNAPTNPEMLQNSYMFMKNIKGTVAYFRNHLYNLLAMFQTLGPPTLFMTLSADDNHWPELAMTLQNISYSEAEKQTSCGSSMLKDPLLTAVHFQRRIHSLLKYVINGDLHPLGIVQDHFIRYEFQKRGSVHAHMFFWIKDIPQVLTEETADCILQYIKRTISANIPSPNVTDPFLPNQVERYQTHRHSPYCQRTKRCTCRFGFPKPISNETVLLTNIQLSSKSKSQFYILKRDPASVYINAYNPTILKHFRSNMNISFVNGAEGAAYYVCYYLCKSEPDELRTALSTLIHDVFKSIPSLTPHQRLFRIGQCILRHRQRSGQEAAFCLGNLNLIETSRETVYVNTRPPNQRYKILKNKSDLELLNDTSSEIFKTNLLDYYHERPRSLQLMTFYYFVAWYKKCPPPTNTRSRNRNFQERIYIKKYDVWLRKKTKFSVIRFPHFPINSENYFYSLLLLLLPHFHEDELLHPYQTAVEAFPHKQNQLNSTSTSFTYFSFAENVDNAMLRLKLIEHELDQSDTYLSQQIHSEHCNVSETIIFPDQNSTSTNPSNPNIFQETNSSNDYDTVYNSTDLLHYHAVHTSTMTLNNFQLTLNQMTPSQKAAFSLIDEHYSNKVTNKPPLHIFLTGGAGVGKTFLTQIIVAYLISHTASIPNHSPVKVCAFTGTAAQNVNGNTIHSTLKIPVHKYHTDYTPLSPHDLQTLRTTFKGVHTLVIDEISMVGYHLFTSISRRLCEIKDNNFPFGNINIITVGDYFQLRPINDNYAFHNTLLWHLFTPIFLKENMRQHNDKDYAHLLNRARIGHLNNRDIDTLKARLITTDTNPYPNSLHIFPTRNAVKQHNDKMQNDLTNDNFIINAENYYAPTDVDVGKDTNTTDIPEDDRTAGDLPSQLCLSIHSRVILIRNICTDKSLVNGVMGFVESFQESPTGDIIAVYVKFDNPRVGRSPNNICNQEHNSIPIHRIQHEYVYHGRHIIRRQFPLHHAWACSIHKIQGQSLDKATVDIGSSIFEKGQSYVALSRVKNINGLSLLALDITQITPPEDVVKEYIRLHSLINNDNKNL